MNKKDGIKVYAEMTLGAIIEAFAIHFFKIPNNFSAGGVSGLGILIGKLFQGTSLEVIDTSTVIFILNILFLVLGWIFLGKRMGVKTIYCTLVYTLVLELLGKVWKMDAPFTNDTFLELILSFVIESIGIALFVRNGGSTGGTSIIALIINKYAKVGFGTSTLVTDILIVGATFFIFDIRTGLYALVGLVLKSFCSQLVIDALNRRKNVMIVTTHPDEIAHYIYENVHRGATEWQGKGAFTDDGRTIIISVMTNMQAAKVSAYSKKVDPHAFIIINNTHEIYGKGFMSLDDDVPKNKNKSNETNG